MVADRPVIIRLSELGSAEPNKPSIVMLSPTFIFVFTASSNLIDLVVKPDSFILRFDAETGEYNIFLGLVYRESCCLQSIVLVN